MPSITFKPHCDKYQVRKDGTSTLYMRITIDRKSKLVSLNKYVDPQLFDYESKRIKNTKDSANSKQLNRFLSDEENRLEDIVLELQKRDKPVSFENVLRDYVGKHGDSFFQYCRTELENEKTQLGARTYYHYEIAIKKLERYKPDLTLHEIDRSFLEKYRNYMVTELHNKQNSYHRDLAYIRKFTKKAYQEGIIKTYPFTNFKFTTEEVTKAHLTIEELRKLHEFYESKKFLLMTANDGRGKTYKIGEKYQHLLQHFLIGCYSGLRYSDIKSLRKEHIVDGKIVLKVAKGRKGQRKTVRIPIKNKLQSLLDLNRLDNMVYDGFVRGSSESNSWLKFIMKEAGIDKYMTFHCSRHTFAVNALVLGIPLEVVSDLLGHTDVKTTQIYAKVVDSLREREMTKWDLLDKF